MKTLLIAALLAFAAGATAQTPASSKIDQLLTSTPASQGVVGIVVDTGNDPEKLSAVPGTINAVYAFVTVLYYADFPELSAPVSVSGAAPTIYVAMSNSPADRLYLVRTKVNQNANDRSVKVGHSKFAGFAGLSVPDPDWCVPFTAKEVKPGEWAITPNAPLKAGQYGVFVPKGINIDGAPNDAPGGSLFGFGVI